MTHEGKGVGSLRYDTGEHNLPWCQRGLHYVPLDHDGACACGLWLSVLTNTAKPVAKPIYYTPMEGDVSPYGKTTFSHDREAEQPLNDDTKSDANSVNSVNNINNINNNTKRKGQTNMAKTEQTGSILDKWKTVSGGLKSDVIMTVETAEFDTNEKYNEGNTLLLILTGKDEEDGEEVKVEWPCGKGWERKGRDGRFAENPENPKLEFFNDRSCVGTVVDLCIMECHQVHEQGLNGLGIAPVIIAKNLPPVDASIWPGMRLHFKRTKLSHGTRKVKGVWNEETETFSAPTEVKMESERLMPVAFLGAAGVEGWEDGYPDGYGPGSDDGNGDDDNAAAGNAKKEASAEKTKTTTTTAGKKTASKAKATATATKAADKVAKADDADVDEDAAEEAAEAAAEAAPAMTKAEEIKAKLAAKKAAAAAAEAAAASAGNDANEGPILTSLRTKYPDDIAKVLEAYEGAEGDFDTFIDLAAAYPEIEANDDLLNTLGNPDLLWAELVG